MAYAFRKRGGEVCLVEIEGRWDKFIASQPKTDIYTLASYHRAHRWVKSGGLHETPLWVDSDGRIRRAGRHRDGAV